MRHKDPRVDAYIERAAPFARPILRHLRKVVHRGCPNVEETIKWSFPHFDYKGMMCGMAAFKQHCSFGFWKRELIFDTGKASGTEPMNWSRKIHSLADLPPDKELLSYIRKAAELNESGIKAAKKPVKKKPAPKVPTDLATALKKNKKAQATFDVLSPSGKREYVEWIVSAKREETRERRLKTAIEWLSQGKPHNWKYIK